MDKVSLIFAAIIFITPPLARAQDCEPLRPEQPINSEIVDQTKASGNILFKKLGSAEIANAFRHIEQDVQSKYPNADRVYIWRCFIYLECTLLKSSHLSDQEKQAKFAALMDSYVKSPPPSNGPASSPSAVETSAAENLNVSNEAPTNILLGNKKVSEWAIIYQETGHVARSMELASRGGNFLHNAYDGLLQEHQANVGIFTNNLYDFVLIYGYHSRIEALSHLDEFKSKRTALGYPSPEARVIDLWSTCKSGVFAPTILAITSVDDLALDIETVASVQLLRCIASSVHRLVSPSMLQSSVCAHIDADNLVCTMQSIASQTRIPDL